MVPGIFLAAGEGKRFGPDKLFSEVGGDPLVVKSLRSSVESSLEEIYVILGHNSGIVEKKIRDYFRDCGKLKYVFNPDYGRGMISSLNCGLSVLKDGTPGAMMILGDMPFISPATINRLIGSWNGSDFLIPEVNGKKTHPRIIPGAIFKDFLGMRSFISGKEVLKRNRHRIKTLLFRNEEEFIDIDLKSDLPDQKET